MMPTPIFARALADHGLTVAPRPLGAVSTGLHLIPDPELISGLIRLLKGNLCWRCSDGTGATCEACVAEIQMRDDDASHAAECARYEAAASALADDEWGEL